MKNSNDVSKLFYQLFQNHLSALHNAVKGGKKLLIHEMAFAYPTDDEEYINVIEIFRRHFDKPAEMTLFFENELEEIPFPIICNESKRNTVLETLGSVCFMCEDAQRNLAEIYELQTESIIDIIRKNFNNFLVLEHTLNELDDQLQDILQDPETRFDINPDQQIENTESTN